MSSRKSRLLIYFRFACVFLIYFAAFFLEHNFSLIIVLCKYSRELKSSRTCEALTLHVSLRWILVLPAGTRLVVLLPHKQTSQTTCNATKTNQSKQTTLEISCSMSGNSRDFFAQMQPRSQTKSQSVLTASLNPDYQASFFGHTSFCYSSSTTNYTSNT